MTGAAKNDNVVVMGDRSTTDAVVQQPLVTRLTSKPAVRVIDGRLVAVLEIPSGEGSKAA